MRNELLGIPLKNARHLEPCQAGETFMWGAALERLGEAAPSGETLWSELDLQWTYIAYSSFFTTHPHTGRNQT